LLIVFTVFPIGALALSASRAGILCFLFEFVLLASLMRNERKRSRQLLMAGGLAVLAGLFALWLGLGGTAARFAHLTRGDLSHDRRVSMFRDTWRIVRNHPWTGTGLGTLQTVFPGYESYYDGLIVDHAHNDYLELLADTGLAGGACMFGFVGLLIWRGLSNLRAAKNPLGRSFYSGALVACAGLLLHSLFDFNLHIPANALLFLLLAAMTTSDFVEPRQSYPQTSLRS
jgi:O-antigen ligase